MTRRALLVPLLLGLFVLGAAAQEAGGPETPSSPPVGEASNGTQASEDEEDQEWGVNSLRGSFEAVSGYFDSMLEFMGGRDGVCQYRCRFGESRGANTSSNDFIKNVPQTELNAESSDDTLNPIQNKIQSLCHSTPQIKAKFQNPEAPSGGVHWGPPTTK